MCVCVCVCVCVYSYVFIPRPKECTSSISSSKGIFFLYHASPRMVAIPFPSTTHLGLSLVPRLELGLDCRAPSPCEGRRLPPVPPLWQRVQSPPHVGQFTCRQGLVQT